MKVLVACEFSGVVREAFKAKGHDAWSCDLLPTEIPGQHIQGDVLEILDDGWDMMIAHPPYTYLCKRKPERWAKTEKAAWFAIDLMGGRIPRIALIIPIGCLSTIYRKPDQIIQPWQFGHPERKATCLWLKNLPKLTPTNVLQKPENGRWNNQTPSGQNKLGLSHTRAMERSRTYTGIVAAMADQWS